MMFSMHKQKSHSKKSSLGVQCRTCVYYVYSATIRFFCASH